MFYFDGKLLATPLQTNNLALVRRRSAFLNARYDVRRLSGEFAGFEIDLGPAMRWRVSVGVVWLSLTSKSSLRLNCNCSAAISKSRRLAPAGP